MNKDILKYKEFIGTVSFSAEDRVFYGKVEGINDLVTFEGTNVDELEKAFKYMVDEHIKDCKKEGIPLEKSYKGNLNVRLSPKLHKKMAQIALLKGVSLNKLISETLRKGLSAG
jgi:predicted HicB family RNase H-like nuclease